MVLYIMCSVETEDKGKAVCVSRIKVRDIEEWTDETAEQMLQDMKRRFLEKIEYPGNEEDCTAEYIPQETFIEYAGAAIVNEMTREMQRRKREEEES